MYLTYNNCFRAIYIDPLLTMTCTKNDLYIFVPSDLDL